MTLMSSADASPPGPSKRFPIVCDGNPLGGRCRNPLRVVLRVRRRVRGQVPYRWCLPRACRGKRDGIPPSRGVLPHDPLLAVYCVEGDSWDLGIVVPPVQEQRSELVLDVVWKGLVPGAAEGTTGPCGRGAASRWLSPPPVVWLHVFCLRRRLLVVAGPQVGLDRSGVEGVAAARDALFQRLLRQRIALKLHEVARLVVQASDFLAQVALQGSRRFLDLWNRPEKDDVVLFGEKCPLRDRLEDISVGVDGVEGCISVPTCPEVDVSLLLPQSGVPRENQVVVEDGRVGLLLLERGGGYPLFLAEGILLVVHGLLTAEVARCAYSHQLVLYPLQHLLAGRQLLLDGLRLLGPREDAAVVSEEFVQRPHPDHCCSGALTRADGGVEENFGRQGGGSVLVG